MMPESHGGELRIGDNRRLSVRVRGEWSAQDVLVFYYALVLIYRLENFLFVKEYLPFRQMEMFGSPRTIDEGHIFDFLLGGTRRDYPSDAMVYMSPLLASDLQVRKIDVASPGNHEFSGAAKAIATLGQLILALIDAKHRQRMSDVEYQREIDGLLRDRMETFKRLEKFSSEMNFSSDKVHEIKRKSEDCIEQLLDLIASKKLIGVNEDPPRRRR